MLRFVLVLLLPLGLLDLLLVWVCSVLVEFSYFALCICVFGFDLGFGLVF